MENILIVDGSNLLFQMFYGMPARIINQHGRPVQGTVGFFGALLKMIRWVQPTRLAVLFDGECGNNRSELDENYKANREDYAQMQEEETPFSQLADIYTALDYLGICHAETTDCETDDWVASYALSYGREHKITIASQDSDFFQLIGKNVSVLRYRGDKSVFCDRNWLFAKFGIEPEQYADYKAMVGDSADNIRGAEKIGPKTASQLLQQFESLDYILSNTEQVTKKSVRESLIKNEPRLRLNQLLIRLEANHAVPFALEDMVFSNVGRSSTQILKELRIL